MDEQNMITKRRVGPNLMRITMVVECEAGEIECELNGDAGRHAIIDLVFRMVAGTCAELGELGVAVVLIKVHKRIRAAASGAAGEA